MLACDARAYLPFRAISSLFPLVGVRMKANVVQYAIASVHSCLIHFVCRLFVIFLRCRKDHFSFPFQARASSGVLMRHPGSMLCTDRSAVFPSAAQMKPLK